MAGQTGALISNDNLYSRFSETDSLLAVQIRLSVWLMSRSVFGPDELIDCVVIHVAYRIRSDDRRSRPLCFSLPILINDTITVVIIGLGKVGISISGTLHGSGRTVIGYDISETASEPQTLALMSLQTTAASLLGRISSFSRFPYRTRAGTWSPPLQPLPTPVPSSSTRAYFRQRRL